ncbi:hypothetical protein LA345_25730 [Burkholderia vietnamiensis]|uniref:Uncharacterized protein n=1 Tax=Burkholderia vietnamiensis (strain G4 / LMG 22486) TaxID=269482 RepID=A4JD07_BURVG|nr:hypothetical protein [Burkholderia vietnamiensis]ABO54160.1 hypothetical protein Bcep1808_1149 [Burkholderia vietnamiensis G4]ABO57464.1 hypothetical protein Bcep1808_4500 [Burkholderia vietnamiensis G4]MCB4342467.1 hypothetical protein [Burkholderia vietnamiensis]MCB4347287.1 hypothetical protein [Burkholderia vietnamiensis]
MKEPILSREEVEALAHRICVRYFHSENIHLRQYTFGITTLEQFAQAYEAALLEKLCGEPVAWMVLECVHLKPCSVTLDREDIEGHRPEHVVSLYALNRSKA